MATPARREIEPSSLTTWNAISSDVDDAAPEPASTEGAASAETRVSATLGLGPAYLAKAESLRRKFNTPGRTDPTGEQILEELVATETPIAMALQDAEAALVSLLHKSITDPNLALAVMKLLKETVTVSNAVRRRIENSLGAIANLRAQRDFLERQGR